MLNPVTRGYAGPFRGRVRGRKKKRLLGVARGRSKIVMLNALSEMRMQMGNANGFIVVAERFIGQMKVRMFSLKLYISNAQLRDYR